MYDPAPAWMSDFCSTRNSTTEAYQAGFQGVTSFAFMNVPPRLRLTCFQRYACDSPKASTAPYTESEIAWGLGHPNIGIGPGWYHGGCCLLPQLLLLFAMMVFPSTTTTARPPACRRRRKIRTHGNPDGKRVQNYPGYEGSQF